MSTGILLLSPELQRLIIDFLLEPEPELPIEDDVETDGHEDGDKEHLVPATLQTLSRLSQTCSTFRTLLAPLVYSKLYLTNTKASVDSIKAVADGPFHDLVKELLFVGRAPGSEEEGFDDTETVLPKAAKHVLANIGHLFPQLNSLNVGFACDLTDFEKWDDWPWESFLEEETDEQVLEEEKSYGFRALIDQVWAAISSNTNTNSHIRSLKIRYWIPKMSSVYSSESFQKFLSKIQNFSISIWGADSGVGWETNVGIGYRQSLTNLERIFNALTSCTDFTLEASQYGWYGLQGANHAPHGFHRGQMPLLRRLSLRHCFISPELSSFIQAHADTMEEIVLSDCAASINTDVGLAENGLEWRALFDAMPSMELLQKFELEWKSLGWTLSKRNEDTDEAIKAREEFIKKDESKRIFAYGFLDDKYAYFRDDDEMNVERYNEGNDQRSWNALQATIDEHRRKNETDHVLQ